MVSLNNKAVVPARLDHDSKFNFRCYPGIKCFTRCCRNIEILLTPYDVLRIKNRLGISSTEFLAQYTYFKEDEKTTHPLLLLRMSDAEDRACPFVRQEDGCTVYADRPAACRYYPVGQVTHRRLDDKTGEPVHDEWYVQVKEDHCRGFEEEKTWTVAEWRRDQESALYDEMNREWKNIMMKQDLPKESAGKQKRQQMFYLASYDIDGFRRFVFESRFLEIFDVDPERRQAISEDETELMKFAFRYLKYLLGISRELDVKPHVAEAQRRQVEEKQARQQAERQARIDEIDGQEGKDNQA